jgi:hypothetical protein
MPQYRGELRRTQYAVGLFDAADDDAAADFWDEHGFDLLDSGELTFQDEEWDCDEAPYEVG